MAGEQARDVLKALETGLKVAIAPREGQPPA